MGTGHTGMGSDSEQRPVPLDEDLEAIFGIVKGQTGHDFSGYKRDTVVRRIHRRMAVANVSDFPAYASLLRENLEEAVALSHEILIGVTSFFRDAEAFGVLESEVISPLFAESASTDSIRVWAACCATGEEVYSLAILLHEAMERAESSKKVQIFATDLDKRSIAQARSGFFSDMAVAPVGDERRARYFVQVEGRWQVAKFLREMIVFAHHDVLKDPPFSRLDLVVCRNFLIYLKHDMQKRLLLLFHQALRPGGVLFLGNSETAGDADLFAALNRKWKIYRRIENGRRPEMVFNFLPYAPLGPLPRRMAERSEMPTPEPDAFYDKLVIERHSPPSVVVNDKYELVYNSASSNPFLRIPGGAPTRDILRLVCEELRPPLRAAIHKVFTDGGEVVFRNLKAILDPVETGVDLIVERVAGVQGKLAMIVFRPAPLLGLATGKSATEGIPEEEVSKDMLIRQLEDQLRIMHDQLVSTVEQLETSNDGLMSTNEELMSINEEYQATNEELQATNEELETSKEELQAVNEELATVNVELQGKVEELDRTNADLENFLHSAEIATIFLDRDLRIRRFTPAMASLFGLIPADVGRPFRHVARSLDWDTLEKDAETVLETVTLIEREVAIPEFRRECLLRILPYNVPDVGVLGVVLTLIDMTELKAADRLTRHLASFPQLNPNPVLEFSFSGEPIFHNPATRLVLKELGIEDNDTSLFLPPDMTQILATWDGKSEMSLFRECLIGGRSFGETVFLSPKLNIVRIYAYDITPIREAQEDLRKEAEQRRLALEAGCLGSWDYRIDSGLFFCDERCRETLGIDAGTPITYETVISRLHPDDLPVIQTAVARAAAGEGAGTFHHEFRSVWPDGSVHWVGSHGKIHFEGEGAERRAVRFVGVNLEITERKRVQERLDILAETADRLLRSESPQAVVDELCRRVMNFLDCQVFFNFLVDLAAPGLYLNACAGVSPEVAAQIHRLEFGTAVCGCVARDGVRIVVNDVDTTEDPRTELVNSFGVRAYACHPLVMQDRIIGTLSFGTTTRTSFAPDELYLMKTVADQVAIAIARKQAEEALRNAEAVAVAEKNLLKTVMDALPVGLSILDSRGGILECNDAFHEVWGGSLPPTGSVKAYAEYRAWWPGGHPVQPEEWASAIALKTGKKVVGQFMRIAKFDGTSAFAMNSGAPIFDSSGAVTGCVVAITDVTAWKKAEERISRQNSMFSGINRILSAALSADSDEDLSETCLTVAEEITDSRFGFIGHIGVDGLLTDITFSNAGRELCTMHDKAGHRWPHEDQQVHGIYGRVLVDGKGFFTNDPGTDPDRLRLPEGHPPLERFLAVPLLRDGKTIGMIAVANRNSDYREEDLQALEALAPVIVEAYLRKRAEAAVRAAKETLEATVAERTRDLAETVARLTEEMQQRQQAEEVLQKNEALQRTVLETLPVGVALLDRTGTINYFNPAAVAIWEGAEQGGSAEYSKFRLFHHETGIQVCPDERPSSRALATGEPVIGEVYDIETFTGDRKTIMSSSVPIRDAEGNLAGAVAVMEDITVQQELQRQLHHSQRLESVGSLAGGIAHDFNNLLMAICGYTESVVEELDEESEWRQSLSYVLSAGMKAKELTHKLLTFSRQQVIEMKPVNLSEVVCGAVRFLDRVLPETIQVHEEVHPGIHVQGDPSQLEQVVTNIIINARDAMPQGGHLTVCVKKAPVSEAEAAARGLAKPGTYAVTTITDTGSGILPMHLDRVFEPFFTTKATGKGTGLGLSIAYGIIRQHGGIVSVESKAGEGTTFSLYLPLFDTPVLVEQRPVEVAVPKGRETVLVVEDDAVVREYLRLALKKAGYNVIAAEDGIAALEVVSATEIHIVITDVIMPKMNGMEMYAELKKKFPGLRIIFMSGYAADVVTDQFSVEKATVFLQKPVSRNALLTTVRSVLDGG